MFCPQAPLKRCPALVFSPTASRHDECVRSSIVSERPTPVFPTNRHVLNDCHVCGGNDSERNSQSTHHASSTSSCCSGSLPQPTLRRSGCRWPHLPGTLTFRGSNPFCCDPPLPQQKRAPADLVTLHPWPLWLKSLILLEQFRRLGFVSVLLVQARGFDSVVLAFVRSYHGMAMARVDEHCRSWNLSEARTAADGGGGRDVERVLLGRRFEAGRHVPLS